MGDGSDSKEGGLRSEKLGGFPVVRGMQQRDQRGGETEKRTQGPAVWAGKERKQVSFGSGEHRRRKRAAQTRRNVGGKNKTSVHR